MVGDLAALDAHDVHSFKMNLAVSWIDAQEVPVMRSVVRLVCYNAVAIGEFGSECSVREPRMLETFTIRPAGAFRMSGNSFWVSATGARKFVVNVSRRVSGDTALVWFGAKPAWLSFKTPALLTRISSRPYVFAK